MNKSLSQEVENRLWEWAEWYARIGDLGLGYPHQSVESKLICIRFDFQNTKTMDSNPVAEETEEWLRQLNFLKPESRLAVNARYLSPKYMPISRVAAKLNVSVRTVEDRLRDARLFLGTKLMDKVPRNLYYAA